MQAPTRELAEQIHSECQKLGQNMEIRAICIVGGDTSVEAQGTLMSHGAEVVIATPGRLYDLIQRRHLVLHQCRYVVLDEADRMLMMDRDQHITRILEKMPASNVSAAPMTAEDWSNADSARGLYRQTIMFSATMAPSGNKLVSKCFVSADHHQSNVCCVSDCSGQDCSFVLASARAGECG